ncbi:hypothetical protein ACW6QP_14105 [Salegentibacter sp. HM20]
MNELFDFYIEKKIYVTFLMEFLAAFTGSLFLLMHSKVAKNKRLFVYFLWSIFIIDFLGGYSLWAYFDNYQTVPFLKDSPFQRNTWYFNLAQIYFILCYSYFIQSEILNPKFKIFIRRGAALYLIYSAVLIILGSDIFQAYNVPIILVGAIWVSLSVGLYFYDLFTSDKILYFKNNLFFYVFTGIFIYYLVVQPINIYSAYFLEANPDFINLFANVLRYANIFLYGIYIIGFIIVFLNKTERQGLKKV